MGSSPTDSEGLTGRYSGLCVPGVFLRVRQFAPEPGSRSDRGPRSIRVALSDSGRVRLEASPSPSD